MTYNYIPEDWDGKTFVDESGSCPCCMGHLGGFTYGNCELCQLREFLKNLDNFIPHLKKMGFEIKRTVEL